MDFFEWSSKQPLSISKIGIPEPFSKKKIYPDIILVPMLAFDKHKFRLGYGGGFYDRALESVPKEKIWSIIYDFQHVYDFWGEDHDIKVSMVFTNSKLLSIN